jgi:glycosyltransferase involved in cell wall biosynthesis
MDKRKIKVLHITSHLGGGVGKVLLGYLEKAKDSPGFSHKVISLEYANEKALSASREMGFPLVDKMSSDHRGIITEIAKADIVLIHWWNHPLIYDFLVRERLPASRVIIWSHISGFHPPYVFTEKILKYPDVFVFTTPASLKTREVKKLSEKQKKHLRVVWSTGGVEKVRSVGPREHSGFNIGYIGTVDYAKLHPDFLNICDKINIPDVKFIVCGGPGEKEIGAEAEKMGIAKKFIFTGLVPDITEYLPLFDVFGYPLAPDHYGTCDQVLAESMAAGVVPVVLKNRMEKYMVKDGITGIVAKSEDDYVKAVQTLYKDKSLRKELSENARKYAVKTFSVDEMAGEWEAIFREALAKPKTSKAWNIAQKKNNIQTSDVFLESLGGYGEAFLRHRKAKSENEKTKAAKKILKLNESAIWKAETRGTVHHYKRFFPDDEVISFWSDLMKK